jgi:predicted ATPase
LAKSIDPAKLEGEKYKFGFLLRLLEATLDVAAIAGARRVKDALRAALPTKEEAARQARSAFAAAGRAARSASAIASHQKLVLEVTSICESLPCRPTYEAVAKAYRNRYKVKAPSRNRILAALKEVR